MHEKRYLHLPVVESDGTVAGMIDVMDVICSLMNGDMAELFWGSDENDKDDETLSQTSSVNSRGRNRLGSSSGSTNKNHNKNVRTVSKLRPDKPIIMSCDSSIFDVVQAMAKKYRV